MKRAAMAGLGLAVIVGVGSVAAAGGRLPDLGTGANGTASPGAADAADLATAEVERRTLQTSADLDGTLGYEGSLQVHAGGAGTLTRVPADGTIVRRGGWLYELDGTRRARLLYGARPMWRALDADATDGTDIEQLERNLKALGFAPKGMKVNRHWDAKTTTAVKRWQKATRQARDGRVETRDVVFLPGPIRIASAAADLGAAIGPGSPVLDATGAGRVVTLDLAASRQDLVVPGSAVTVELPDGSMVDGTIRAVGTVATASQDGSGSTVPVTIDLAKDATLPAIDAAPVTVYVTTETRADVLAVPVNALLALLEGGYAVEVVDAAGAHRYVGVETGLFEDAMVEVTGDGLEAGMTVVVPR